MGFGVWGLGFGVWGLGFGVWGFWLRVISPPKKRTLSVLLPKSVKRAHSATKKQSVLSHLWLPSGRRSARPPPESLVVQRPHSNKGTHFLGIREHF